jgi:hypothetical protein
MMDWAKHLMQQNSTKVNTSDVVDLTDEDCPMTTLSDEATTREATLPELTHILEP